MQVIHRSKELRDSIQNFKNLDKKHSKPIVITWGLMNAGKSYLLNMLTQHIETEFFKTNDFRETSELKAYETPLCTYLDTPGLDANIEDNLVALKGAKYADVVLFVHQLQGELEMNEVNFLQDIKTSFGEFAEKNIILVLSKIDKENAKKVEEIQTRILEQCEENLGFQPMCFKISNMYYQTGVKNHKDGLVRHSHIEDLKQHIMTILENSEQVRLERKNSEQQKLLQQLTECKDEIAKIIEQKRLNILEGFNDFNNATKDLTTFIDSKAKQYSEIY